MHLGRQATIIYEWNAYLRYLVEFSTIVFVNIPTYFFIEYNTIIGP